MKVTLGYFKDDEKEWVSVLIDNIAVAQQCVKDIVGNTVVEQTLHAHGLYDRKSLTDSIINIDTAKVVFDNICKKMYDKETVIMNIEGGHIAQKYVDWNMVKTKTFEVHYSSSILNLLRQENNIAVDSFKEID